MFWQNNSIVDIQLSSEYTSDSRLIFIAKSNAFFYLEFANFQLILSILFLETPILIFLLYQLFISFLPASFLYKPLVLLFLPNKQY